MKKFSLLALMLFSSYLLADPFAIVPKTDTNSASIVDLATLAPIADVPCGTSSIYVAVTSSGSLALVTNPGSGTNALTAIDLTTPAYTPTAINLIGSALRGIVITPGNQKALISNPASNEVAVLDIPTLTFQTSIALSGTPAPLKNSIVLATGITSVPNLALVANQTSSAVTPIDLSTLTALADIPVGITPVNIAVSAAQKKALVVGPGNIVVPIDLVTRSPLSPIALPSAAHNVFVIDSLNLAFVTSISSVIPIDLVTLSPLSSITVGASPSWIAISSNMAFVTNQNSDTLTPINLSTLSPLSEIAVGSGPTFCAIAPTTTTLLTTNFGDSNLSTIDTIALSSGSNIAIGGRAQDIGFFGFTLPSPVSSPSNFSGSQKSIKALFQKDLVNALSWAAPASGIPAFYRLYRDSSLTDLVAVIDGNQTSYFDHGRKKGVVYSYFLVAVDASGNASSPSSITLP